MSEILQRLKEEQQEITRRDIVVKQFIKNIWDCESDETLNELNVCIARESQIHRNAIEKLSEKECFLAEIDAYRNQLESNFTSLRKANAHCRKIIDEKAKESLFAVNSDPKEKDGLRHRNTINDKILVNKATNVTESLQTVSRMLADQVNASQQSLQTLVNSSALTTETNEEFKAMNSAISQSKKLLVKYGRREVTDKVLIFLALAFFFASVLYVITKRLFR
ncbi:vesicle transport protein SEC20-like protein [Leptotrombidium deliense]|uniref:Vesicle transport protein SEC20-like protein n=1 Tax=Leptotrombidium deliense TaxID=299467 RepID=A0A443SPK4_9ACAR|nr:vesicle transport protein SEC20-like protein [Leptotrombidium deliense]